MKMIDLKMPKMSQPEPATAPVEKEGPNYPYGMRLTFEDDQVEQVPGMEKYKGGDRVKIVGLGEVVDIRTHEGKDKKLQYTVEVQLLKVGCDSMEGYDQAWKESTGEGGGDTWEKFHERAEREEASTKIV